ncbi:hypothetical protein EMIHUDRAFT_245191 [Emiliania huxleyi CCMP1516]|uniref:Uncharacterized protein n=2 Tax=Emiliania huxleyi TaxID=2903 RepID=A0A0D3IY90_EMIH1|nr:hypothetical protein EMIHUDRAFT_245191 [Emiliania huxleyi CCMP1516]EOD16225.1 hypothetical protein EMIHUDRAFT_245191 [Emiliania huxleyi CCMP1516]|eukprot:XP_005768654.1 hypothetical protein EMIHUDRAFT_245191 [Emiliania huxleyi CCMP1516]
MALVDEVERALHQPLKLLLVPPLDALFAQLVPQVRSVDVVQARAVASKEREQLVGAAGMGDLAVELFSIELTTGSRALPDPRQRLTTGSTAASRGALIAHSCIAALPLVASSFIEDRRCHPAIAGLRLAVAPEIVGPVIAPIVPVTLALASAATVVIAVMQPWFASPTLIAPWLVVTSLRGPSWFIAPSKLIAPLRHTSACADFFCAEGGVKFTGGRVDDFVKLSKAANKLIHGRTCAQPSADVFAPNRTGCVAFKPPVLNAGTFLCSA